MGLGVVAQVSMVRAVLLPSLSLLLLLLLLVLLLSLPHH